jgi:hypothetical protein
MPSRRARHTLDRAQRPRLPSAARMYQWVVFLHVASVLAFMLAHGVHVTAMWAFRREPDPERAMTFFNDLPTTMGLRVLLAAVVVSGAWAGVAGSWWASGWMWTSLILLAVIAVAMWRFGGGYFGLVQAAAEAAIAVRSADPANPGPQAEFDATRRSWHTVGMTALGLGGLAVILWLMMFKPF